jgi:hypothetical protein
LTRSGTPERFFVFIIGGRSLPHLTLTEVWLVIFELAIIQAITLYPTGRARPPQGAPSDGYSLTIGYVPIIIGK